jgi:hypothetical protein
MVNGIRESEETWFRKTEERPGLWGSQGRRN